MRSNVNVVNHPVHPILVLIPVGAWITSLVFDIIFMATGTPFWFVAAFWTMIVGIAGALLAAITGMYDLFTLPLSDEPKKVGYTHMVLNLLIVALYVINVAAIRSPIMNSAVSVGIVPTAAGAWGLVLNIVSVVLLLVSGWLGGELIYRYGVAVPRDTMERAPRYQTRVMPGETGMAGALGGESPPQGDK